MPIDFYYFQASPPCRAVMLVAKYLGIELNMKTLNIMAGEHKSEEFGMINPQQTIPTINDNGFILWESRPIMSYLVNQYAKDDSLYPKDPQEQAKVDQRLYFDMGTLFMRKTDYYYPTLFTGAPLVEAKLKKLEEAVGWLNTMLEETKFAAGNRLTIADFSLVVTVSNLEAFGFNLSVYPSIEVWYKRVKDELTPFGYEEINQKGANMMGGMLKSKLG